MMQLSNVQQITTQLNPSQVPSTLEPYENGLPRFRRHVIGMQEGKSRTPRGRTDTISHTDVFSLFTIIIFCHGTNGFG